MAKDADIDKAMADIQCPGAERKTGEKDLSRRKFIKNAAIGGIALSSTTGLMKFFASMVPDDGPQKAYLRDVLAGDRAMMEKEYVLMTDEEKEELIQMFIENYSKSRVTS